jgi:importin subunit alpha-1
MPGSEGVNPYARAIEAAEGLDKIEALQDHPSEDVYEKAVHILEVGLG